MNYWETIRDTCVHQPHRMVILNKKIVHWRCKCGRIVKSPVFTLEQYYHSANIVLTDEEKRLALLYKKAVQGGQLG